MNNMMEYGQQLITSKIDTRNYKLLKLANGLKCLIVSDHDSDKAAAALSVNIGGYYVPKEYPGLAHFLEHMLFFGSAAYPDEKYYTEYITQHGGGSNAFTSNDETTYHFDINSEHFEHALDIFSHFFIDPIFNEEMILREVNAVDSEFFGNYNSDPYRLHQMMHSLIDPSYPVTNFNCGNKTTLLGPEGQRPELFNEMVKFYRNYYSADQMTLTVLSNQSIAVLEKMIVSKFTPIKKHDHFLHPKDGISKNLLPYTDFLNKNINIPLVKVVPLGAKNKIIIHWQLPSSYTNYKCKCEQFWSNIIGHEGPNSLLSYLKNLSYVTSLSSGSNVNPLFDLFSISMILTEHGNNNVEKIITAVFQFIEKMHTLSDEKINQLYEENRKISQINFDNKSKEDPESYTLQLVNNLCRYEDEHVLSGDSHYDNFDDNVLVKLKEYINYMYFTKPILVHLNKNYEDKLDCIEQYYQTSYQIDWIPIDVFKNYDSSCNKMNAPAPNIFIPNDLSLIDSSLSENGSMEVIQLHQSKAGELWYHYDTQFKQPKICVEFEILLPESLNTINDKILADVYVSVIHEIINEHLYSATLTNNYYAIEMKNKLHVSVYGYSDKLLNVWFTILNAINVFNCDAQLFSRIVENEKRKYQAFQSSNTISQAIYHVRDIFIKNTIYYKDALEFLNTITLDTLKIYEQSMYTNCYYIGYMCGNVSLELCGKFHSMFQELIKSKTIHLVNHDHNNQKVFHPFNDPSYETVQKPVYNYEPFNEKEIDVNSSSVILFDFGNEHMNDHKNAVMSSILETIIDDAFFDQLRTKQQLGYCVQCTRYKYDYLDKNKSGLFFAIQSSTYESAYLQQQINEFLPRLFEFVTQESFDRVVDSLIVQLSEPFQRFDSMARYYFSEIIKKSFSFNTRELQIKAAKELHFEEFVQYINKMILKNNQKITINVN